MGLLFQLLYPEGGERPRVRFMSAFEQKVEPAQENKGFQYLLVAAEPYETVAFKLQAKEVERSGERYWEYWDEDRREFWVQLFFKTEREERYAGVPGRS